MPENQQILVPFSLFTLWSLPLKAERALPEYWARSRHPPEPTECSLWNTSGQSHTPKQQLLKCFYFELNSVFPWNWKSERKLETLYIKHLNSIATIEKLLYSFWKLHIHIFCIQNMFVNKLWMISGHLKLVQHYILSASVHQCIFKSTVTLPLFWIIITLKQQKTQCLLLSF